MKRFDLLQRLEMDYPSREDWWISEEPDADGIIKIAFALDKDDPGTYIWQLTTTRGKHESN
jgi:hypothetical protein